MTQPPLIEKQLQQLPHQLLLKTLCIAFLYLSLITLLEAASYSARALIVSPNEPASSLNAFILCFLVVASGSLLFLAGWRFPALRLTIWQILLILVGSCLGLVFSFQHISYQSMCCMFGYQIGHGYPFPLLRLSIVTDNFLSWPKVYDLMRQHPDQMKQDIAWELVIANGMFYAHATLILVVMFRSASQPFLRLARRH